MKSIPRINISHALPEDSPTVSNDNGWLSHFAEALLQRLAPLRDDAPVSVVTVSPDNNSTPTADALLCVITPQYLRSERCHDLLRDFVAAHASDNKLSARNRIFVVIATHLPGTLLPVELQGLRQFDFSRAYSYRDNGDQVTAIDPGSSKEFWLALDDLAFAVRDLLDRTMSLAGSSKPAVFLAEPSPDLTAERNSIRRELQRHGFLVSGVAPLADQAAFESMVRQELGRAAVSVHFIGNASASHTRDSETSASEIQYRIATEHAETHTGFRRIVWVPQSLNVADARSFSDAAGKIEVVGTTLEDLKSVIVDALQWAGETNTTENGAENTRTTRNSRARLYLIHDRRDAEAVIPLAEHISSNGLQVLLPELDADHVRLRQQHFQYLNSCDAALIFYGSVNEQWVRMKQQDLRKAAGYGRERDLLAAIYVGREESESKKRFQAPDLTVIRHFGEFAPESIASFVEQIRHAATEPAL